MLAGRNQPVDMYTLTLRGAANYLLNEQVFSFANYF